MSYILLIVAQFNFGFTILALMYSSIAKETPIPVEIDADKGGLEHVLTSLFPFHLFTCCQQWCNRYFHSLQQESILPALLNSTQTAVSLMPSWDQVPVTIAP